MQKAVETETGKIRVGKTKERRCEGESRKKRQKNNRKGKKQ